MSDDGGAKSGGGVRVNKGPGKSGPSEAPKPHVDRLPADGDGDASSKGKQEERKIESHGRWVYVDDESFPFRCMKL